MAQKRHRVDQIISKLRRADVELGKGKKVPEFFKLIGIAEQTYYRWRQKVGGMQPDNVTSAVFVRPELTTYLLNHFTPCPAQPSRHFRTAKDRTRGTQACPNVP